MANRAKDYYGQPQAHSGSHPAHHSGHPPPPIPWSYGTSGATGTPPYNHHPSTAPPPMSFPQHYMHQLQTFQNYANSALGTNGGQGHNPYAAAMAAHNEKNMFPHGYPSSHSMHFSGLGGYHPPPLPAHSPMPAHLMGAHSAARNSPSPSPLPAHLRSSPYSSTTNYPPYPPSNAFSHHHPGYMPPAPLVPQPPSQLSSSTQPNNPGSLSNGHYSNSSYKYNNGHQPSVTAPPTTNYGSTTKDPVSEYRSLEPSVSKNSSTDKSNSYVPSSERSYNPTSYHQPLSDVPSIPTTTTNNSSTPQVFHQIRGPTVDNSQKPPEQINGDTSDETNVEPEVVKKSNLNKKVSPDPVNDGASKKSKKERLIPSKSSGEKKANKRKNKSENINEDSAPAKRTKENSDLSKSNSTNTGLDDPYSFNEDENETIGSSVEFSRFGKKNNSGPVYKFKNALLSRESRTSSTDSKASSSGGSGTLGKSVPINFDHSQKAFLEACDNFVEDLQTKPVSVSNKPNMDAYRERMAARKEKNANRGRKRKICSNEGESTSPESSPQKEKENGQFNSVTRENDTPKKKSPGRKRKKSQNKVENNNEENHDNAKLSDRKSAKKGGTWALPIVPKLPQKSDKTKSDSQPPSQNQTSNKSKDVDLCDVWRQAFGGMKSKKSNDSSVPIKQESEKEHKKTYLDIPSEVRRKPKPHFGGLIHFAPDWERKVRMHYSKCRLPTKLLNKTSYKKPKILDGKSNNSLRKDKREAPAISPQNKSNLSNHQELSPPKLSAEVALNNGSSPGSKTLCSVDIILAQRKERMAFGRTYKTQERKRMKRSFDELPEESIGLLPTPGLPMLTEDTSEVLLGSNFGNFRRQTLLRYLDSLDESGELKAKVLDWKPEVLETKTRRQSNQVKVNTNFKEIFGIDLPSAGKGKKDCKSSPKKSVKKKLQFEINSENKKDALKEIKLDTEINKADKPIKEEPVEETKAIESKPSISSISTPSKSTSKKTSKKKEKESEKKKAEVKDEESPDKKSIKDPIPSTSTSAPKSTTSSTNVEDEEPEPTEEETALQNFLQTFALDLLDDNLSWSNKAVIQNLVIWEPIGPQIPEKRGRKKAKKHKKRHSGMDFLNKKKGKNKDCGQGDNNDSEKEVRNITYSLTNVINESKNWVTDKGAGETMLHRASKMGYPDVVAYALDIYGMAPTVKDNAGIPPIHLAAFRGHPNIVQILLKYGVDPNTNVKGTRPLHEALEGGNAEAVYHLLSYGSDPLLYDYSGNMPIDLTEDDEDMKRYLSSLLSDLHGKKAGDRWNVSQWPSFILPPESKEDQISNTDEFEMIDEDQIVFETSSHPLPPYYKLSNREGDYVLVSDLRGGKVDAKNAEILEMTWEEFLKSAHCTLLGHSRPHSPTSGKISLVRVDKAIKKQMGIEGLSPSKSTHKRRS